MKRTATAILVVLPLFIAACGTTSDRTEQTSPEAAGDQAPSVAEDRSAEDLGRFSNAIASSSHWSTVRRALPPDPQEMLSSGSGFVRGAVTGVSAGWPQKLSTNEALGVDPKLNPEDGDGKPAEGSTDPPVLVVQDILINVLVAEADGFEGAGSLAGKTIYVPVPVWSGADAPAARADAVASALNEAQAVAPIGTEVVIFVDAMSASDNVVQTAGSRLFGAPAAIVFETSDAGLYSLDWLVADRAEDYLNAATLDESVARRSATG